MKAFKGFDKDFKCRGFQYEVGKTYEDSTADLCKKGFHACELAHRVFGFYAPGKSKFAEVELEGESERTYMPDWKKDRIVTQAEGEATRGGSWEGAD